MPDSSPQTSTPPVKKDEQAFEPVEIPLRDPWLAAFLALLLPGLGHYYQGRLKKAVLYFVTIMTIFCTGVYLAGSSEVGWGRCVYVSFRMGDQRLHFLCQMWVGLPVLPAVLQYLHDSSGHQPLWGSSFMAPPLISAEPRDPQDLAPPFTVHTLNKRLHRYFDLGTVYTMMAGLLNLLVIFDAFAGPVIFESGSTSEEEARRGGDEAAAA